jgi:hypothetical protein
MRRAAAGAEAERKNARITRPSASLCDTIPPSASSSYVAQDDGHYNASTPLLSTECLRNVSPPPFRLAQAYLTPTSTPHIFPMHDTSTHGQYTAPFPPLSTESMGEALARRTAVPVWYCTLQMGQHADTLICAHSPRLVVRIESLQTNRHFHPATSAERPPSSFWTPHHHLPPARELNVTSSAPHPSSHLLHLLHIILMARYGGRKLRMVANASALSNEHGTGSRYVSKE